MTREQIINLINQYIYTNGYQRITGAQLNQILLELAKAFEMEGSAGGDLDAVMEIGSYVSDGREITNDNGGKVKLAANRMMGPQSFEYLGLEASNPQFQAVTYANPMQNTIGAVKRSSPSRDFFDLADPEVPLNDGEFVTATAYIPHSFTDIEPGIHSLAYNQSERGTQSVKAGEVTMGAQDLNNDENNAAVKLSTMELQMGIYSGPQSSEHIQARDYIQHRVQDGDAEFSSDMTISKQIWRDEENDLMEINGSGLKLLNGRRLELNSGAHTVGLTANGSGGNLSVIGGMGVMKIASSSMNLESTSFTFQNSTITYGTLTTEGLTLQNVSVPMGPSTNGFRLYSADQVAGNAVPHFLTENGATVKIYQETTGVAAATLATGMGTPLTDTDTFDGYTLKQIVKALRNQGLLE